MRKERWREFLEVMALFGVAVLLLVIVGFCLKMGGVKVRDGGKGIETHMEEGKVMADMGLGPRL